MIAASGNGYGDSIFESQLDEARCPTLGAIELRTMTIVLLTESEVVECLLPASFAVAIAKARILDDVPTSLDHLQALVSELRCVLLPQTWSK